MISLITTDVTITHKQDRWFDAFNWVNYGNKIILWKWEKTLTIASIIVLNFRSSSIVNKHFTKKIQMQ